MKDLRISSIDAKRKAYTDFREKKNMKIQRNKIVFIIDIKYK